MATPPKKKTCFIIMPISNQDGYSDGHFTRVYNHLIKPACENANFEPIRADDEVKTNYIALDIVKKIIESDLVLCDLSSKNPNVLYELGIRQAFNKKVVLIKDKKTGRIFDIQGFRTIDYDESLRIDEVEKNVLAIASTLTETFASKDGEINSFLQLLSIKPARLSEQIEISQESSIIMEMLAGISERIVRIEDNNKKMLRHDHNKLMNQEKGSIIINGISFAIGEVLVNGLTNEPIGEVVDISGEYIYLKNKNRISRHRVSDPIFRDIDPF